MNEESKTTTIKGKSDNEFVFMSSDLVEFGFFLFSKERMQVIGEKRFINEITSEDVELFIKSK